MYVAALVTMIEVDVAPLLHRIGPVKFEAVRTELPQLFSTVTVGATGTTSGEEVPLPFALVQPLMVWLTVYVAALATMMESLVSPVLHNSAPVKFVATRSELPQLSWTVTVGADGIPLGTEDSLPAGLTHPFKVCVTV